MSNDLRERLVDAFSELMDARAGKADAFRQCEFDRSYFCHDEIEREQEAARVFFGLLDIYIDLRAEEVMKAL